MAKQKKKKKITQPFLKWAGGKRQLLPVFEKFLPEELVNGKIENYYEPFLGSGAVFFFLINKFDFKNIFLSDTNTDLVITYQTIQKDVENLILELNSLQEKYIPLTKEKRKEFYYSIRSGFNSEKSSIAYANYDKKWTVRAAKLIFLNKTCYNGLYRLNSKGEFNTPAGDYKNPRICDEANLLNVSKALNKIHIHVKDFRELTKKFLPNSFVYFDPPYRPLNKTSSFTAYSHNLFSDDDQIALSNIFAELHAKNAKLMLSNSDPKNTDKNDTFFDDLYQGFKIRRIPAKRSINSKADKRGHLNELLITNY